MNDLPPGIHPGRVIEAQLVTGAILRGEIEQAGRGWMRLRTEAGVHFVQLVHVVMIVVQGAGDGPDAEQDGAGGLPRPTSKDVPQRAGSQAPGRPWTDADLRQLADAFLDNHQDAALAARFQRTRAAIKELRRGFECARGNLVEDQISPVAGSWVARWRRVLAG